MRAYIQKYQLFAETNQRSRGNVDLVARNSQPGAWVYQC